MVFMQYKYDHEGRTEELPVKVIDVGIGLERIPWLITALQLPIMTFSRKPSSL